MGTNVADVTAELEELRAQIAALTTRLTQLTRAVGQAAPPPAPVPATAPVEEEIAPELLIALSAAVAAYLGKRAPIRHVRVLGTTAWGQQGRAFIQASHGLNVQHTK